MEDADRFRLIGKYRTLRFRIGQRECRQSEDFRQFARDPFGELLTHVVRAPALLLWLDAQAIRKGNPNQHLGRAIHASL